MSSITRISNVGYIQVTGIILVIANVYVIVYSSDYKAFIILINIFAIAY